MKNLFKTIKTLIRKEVKPNINGIPLYIVKKIEAEDVKTTESFRWKNGRERYNSVHHI